MIIVGCSISLLLGGEPDGSARVLMDDLVSNVAMMYSTDGPAKEPGRAHEGILKRATAAAWHASGIVG
jgi:hypothetical protein